MRRRKSEDGGGNEIGRKSWLLFFVSSIFFLFSLRLTRGLELLLIIIIRSNSCRRDEEGEREKKIEGKKERRHSRQIIGITVFKLTSLLLLDFYFITRQITLCDLK